MPVLPGSTSLFDFMRKFQIAVFVLATAALLAAACFMGKEVGGELRRIGVCALLFDVVCIQLWPAVKRLQSDTNLSQP